MLAALESGDFGGAARLATESGAAARIAGVPWLESFSMSFVAHEAMFAGDVDRAGQLHDKVLTLLQVQGELWGMGIVLFDLALLRVVQHRHEEARALCADAIALARRFGDVRAIAWCLGILAGADAAEGRPTRAARLRGAMEGLLDSIGAPVQPTYTMWIGVLISALSNRRWERPRTNRQSRTGERCRWHRRSNMRSRSCE